MDRLAQENKDKLIDLLTERLAFERAGVQLYDSIIEKINRNGEHEYMRMVPQLMEHRNQEKEHEEWLEEQIRDLGGDAHGETDLSRLIKTESKGLEEVILNGDPAIPHLFHALLTAELVDNSGWDLLVELADEAEDHEARKGFKKRLHEEEEHLEFVHKAVERLTESAFMGVEEEMPTAP